MGGSFAVLGHSRCSCRGTTKDPSILRQNCNLRFWCRKAQGRQRAAGSRQWAAAAAADGNGADGQMAAQQTATLMATQQTADGNAADGQMATQQTATQIDGNAADG